MKYMLTYFHMKSLVKMTMTVFILVGQIVRRLEKYKFKICRSEVSRSLCLLINYFLTDDNTRGFCGQCRSRSDCAEWAVLSLIYDVHIFYSGL